MNKSVPKRTESNCPKICSQGIPSFNGHSNSMGVGIQMPKSRPNPEVTEKASRRRFNADYKLRILDEVDSCTQAGEIGVILRREGLYASHLTTWRRQRKEGEFSGLTERKRGRKRHSGKELRNQNARLQRENDRLRRRLKQAETIIDVQKKISEALGINLKNDESVENS